MPKETKQPGVSKLQMQHRHPLNAIKDTRISGDSVFNGNGRDNYSIVVVWSEIEDSDVQGGFKKLKEATISIRLIETEA